MFERKKQEKIVQNLFQMNTNHVSVHKSVCWEENSQQRIFDEKEVLFVDNLLNVSGDNKTVFSTNIIIQAKSSNLLF
jgi:hypothetical protein